MDSKENTMKRMSIEITVKRVWNMGIVIIIHCLRRLTVDYMSKDILLEVVHLETQKEAVAVVVREIKGNYSSNSSNSICRI